MDEVVLFKWDFANENVMFYCDFFENGNGQRRHAMQRMTVKMVLMKTNARLLIFH